MKQKGENYDSQIKDRRDLIYVCSFCFKFFKNTLPCSISTTISLPKVLLTCFKKVRKYNCIIIVKKLSMQGARFQLFIITSLGCKYKYI